MLMIMCFVGKLINLRLEIDLIIGFKYFVKLRLKQPAFQLQMIMELDVIQAFELMLIYKSMEETKAKFLPINKIYK